MDRILDSVKDGVKDGVENKDATERGEQRGESKGANGDGGGGEGRGGGGRGGERRNPEEKVTIYTLLPRVTFEIRRAEGKRAVRQARADLEDALLHGRLKGESDHPHTAHSIVLH